MEDDVGSTDGLTKDLPINFEFNLKLIIEVSQKLKILGILGGMN